MEWVLGMSLWGLLALFAWALCVAAGRADEQAERVHEDLRRRGCGDE